MKDNTKATWTVDSFDRNRRNAGTTYKVSKTKQGRWHCTCEAFRWGEGQECKHIDWVRNNEDELVPDVESVTGDELAERLAHALQGMHNVTVTVRNGVITLSDR